MTISVTVTVPENADYAAKVWNIDTNPDGGSTTSVAAVLPAGHSSTFYAHSGRSIMVSEFVPPETASPETADTTTV